MVLLNVTDLYWTVEQDESLQLHLPLKKLGFSIYLAESGVYHLQE
jgi:hypothetical protein